MTILLYEEDVKNIIAKHFKISIENISVDEDGEYSIDGIEVLSKRWLKLWVCIFKLMFKLKM